MIRPNSQTSAGAVTPGAGAQRIVHAGAVIAGGAAVDASCGAAQGLACGPQHLDHVPGIGRRRRVLADRPRSSRTVVSVVVIGCMRLIRKRKNSPSGQRSVPKNQPIRSRL